MKVRRILYIGVILILLVIFGVSAFYVGSYFLESHEQKTQYDDLAAIVAGIKATSPSQDDSDPYENTYSGNADEGGETVMLPEYAALYEMNPDIVGWIQIEDTQVNYPVMQTPLSPDYYLRRNFYGDYSSGGCLYARELCDINLPSDNITIYGHNMRDGSMFADLDNYQKKSFWETHDTVTFDTLTAHHTYRIFAVFKTTATLGKGFAYHQFINGNEEEFDSFIATCKALSFYDTGITPVYGDKIICLSTCEYTQTNGRFVVAAVRIG